MSAMLRDLCEQRTLLSQADIALLETFQATLGSIADLIRGDAFIDCMDQTGCAFVAAQASPRYVSSKYTARILGMAALRENEPAVYRAFHEGMPFHDTVANTQENHTVSQDVTPIKNYLGKVVGVLIAERDISREVKMERKLQALYGDWAHNVQPESASDCARNCMQMREAHHRIKNNLQLIASLCAMQARRALSVETRDALKECAGMIMSIAKLHNLLCTSCDSQKSLRLGALLEMIVAGLDNVLNADQNVSFHLICDDMDISSEMAVTIALAVNELVINAVKYAFVSGDGRISIEARRGNRFGTVVVADNGAGFPPNMAKGTGLQIVSDIVRDKLGGTLSMTSDENGAKAAFTFALKQEVSPS